jgi:FixJ family two-component response regulator
LAGEFVATCRKNRPLQVFDLIARGEINTRSAHEIGTTERTVKAHRLQVMETMRVFACGVALSIAGRRGRLDPPLRS